MMTNPDYEMHLRPEEDYEMHFDDAGLKPEQTATVTPTYEAQTVMPDPGCVFSEVTVEAIPEPTEEIDITENGTVDVARYGVANVSVPQGVFPSGTKIITENVTGEDVTNYAAVDVAVPGPTGTKQINITQNGTTTEDVSAYADAEITVNTDPVKGLVFEDYDADGYPHSARFVGTWTEIPARYARSLCRTDSNSVNFGRRITSIPIPNTVKTIGTEAFSDVMSVSDFGDLSTVESFGNGSMAYTTSLRTVTLKDGVILGNGTNLGSCFRATGAKTVTFLGDVPGIPGLCFDNSGVELFDFSHCTYIPPLYGVTSVAHKTGCIFRIPAALSDTTLGVGNGWESATNWAGLTNMVWEVV